MANTFAIEYRSMFQSAPAAGAPPNFAAAEATAGVAPDNLTRMRPW